MHIDPQLLDMIKRHEGLRLKPYRCTAGKLTIGYGRNLEDRGICPTEAEAMLRSDIEAVLLQLADIDEYQKLNAARRAVLADMTFNLGFKGVLAFRRMWAALARGDHVGAATEMLDSKWAQQVGRRAQHLEQIMRTGQWSTQ